VRVTAPSTDAEEAAKAVPTANVVAPSLSGTPRVGSRMTCAPGTWSGTAPLAFSRSWLREGRPIAGATASAYTAVIGDSGRRLSCRVTASNAAGAADATSAGVRVATALALTLTVARQPTLARVLSRGYLTAAARCSVACRLTVRASVSTRSRRYLRLRSRVIASAGARLTRGGRRTLRVRLTRSARSALRRVRLAGVTLELTARDAAGTAARRRARRITLRR
jgi:hypothetical protein